MLLAETPAEERDSILQELRLIAECGQCERRDVCEHYRTLLDDLTVDTPRPDR